VTPPRLTFAATVAVTCLGHLGAVTYEVVVARQFGTTLDADALALALTVALTLANEIVGWIATLLVPWYVRAEALGGSHGATRFVRRSVAAVVGGTLPAALALAVGAAPLAGLLAPRPVVEDLAARLLRLFAPLMVLMPLVAVLGGVLQARERFVAASARPVFWYGGALLGLGGFGAALGAAAVPLGIVGGLILYGGLLLALIAATGRPAAATGLASGAEPVGPAALWPLAVVSVANYVNVGVERAVAARLPAGSLAALTYAFRLLVFPLNLFVLNATTMFFTPLARLAAHGELGEVERRVERALRLALVVTGPLAALAAALAGPAVRVVLERGAFTEHSTSTTARALALYAPAVIGMAAVHVLSRAYQALQEIAGLAWTGLAAIGVNICLMLVLPALVGFPGLPIATSVNWILLAVLMALALRRRLPGLDLGRVGRSAGHVVVAGTAAGTAAWLASGGWDAGIVGLTLGTAAGVVAYGLVMAVLAREDTRIAWRFLLGGRAASA